MVIAFTGDPFLTRRAARAALRERDVDLASVTELGESLRAEEMLDLASQGGLFGQAALVLDFAEAFQGQAGVKPRNEVMKALERVQESAIVVVLDPDATAARQKAFQKIGEHRHLPTPRFEQLPRWIAAELKAAGVRHRPDVPGVLADLFGEDPAAIASEIQKLAALDEEYDADRVRQLVNRAAVHDAFDLIEAIATGDAAGALGIARQLLDEGEAPQRVFGALVWQFQLVARAVALLERERPRKVGASQAASVLRAKPRAAARALELAARIDEPTLRAVLGELLEQDVRGKSGGDAELALETAVVRLSRYWRPASAPAR